jgi:hypothetical protein
MCSDHLFGADSGLDREIEAKITKLTCINK